MPWYAPWKKTANAASAPATAPVTAPAPITGNAAALLAAAGTSPGGAGAAAVTAPAPVSTPAAPVSWRDELKSMTELVLKTPAVGVFKDQDPLKGLLAAFAVKTQELDTLETDIAAKDAELGAALDALDQATAAEGGLVNAGRKNFRGAVEPTLYIPAKNNPTYKVRGNYMVGDYRFSNTNNSYNAVLTKMRARQTALGPIVTRVNAAEAAQVSAYAALNKAKAEYRDMALNIVKVAKELLARGTQEVGETYKQAQKTKANTSAAPQTQLQRLQALRARATGKRGGASRKNRKNNTRKGRRNTRR